MKPDPTPSRSPSARLVLIIGSIGPFGYLPASGTLTVACVGIPLFYWSHEWPAAYRLVAVVLLAGASVWIHQVGDRILGAKDSRTLVWDEVVGYLVAVLFLPWTWQIAATAFVIERALDIGKIPPADQIEQDWPGGLGVVGDDVVAGAYTCIALHLLVYVAPGWMGVAA